MPSEGQIVLVLWLMYSAVLLCGELSSLNIEECVISNYKKHRFPFYKEGTKIPVL